MINRSIISEGSIIHGDKIERSIVGIRARIGEGTTIKDSIVLGNDFFETLEKMVHHPFETPMGIAKNCVIERAIVDKNCRIGNNVKIIGHPDLPNEKTDTHTTVDGIVVLRKGAHIPDGTVIGHQS